MNNYESILNVGKQIFGKKNTSVLIRLALIYQAYCYNKSDLDLIPTQKQISEDLDKLKAVDNLTISDSMLISIDTAKYAQYLPSELLDEDFLNCCKIYDQYKDIPIEPTKIFEQ